LTLPPLKHIFNKISLDNSLVNNKLRIHRQSVVEEGENGNRKVIENSFEDIKSGVNVNPHLDKSVRQLVEESHTQAPRRVVFVPIFNGIKQVYKECIVKDGDILFERSDILLSPGRSPLVPVRLTMNTQKIEVRLSPTNKLFEIKFSQFSEFHKDKLNDSCFQIISLNGSRFKFCELSGNRVPHSTAEEWINDIHMFITGCTGNFEVNNNKVTAKCRDDGLIFIKSYISQINNFIRVSLMLIQESQENKCSTDENKLSYLSKTIQKYDDLGEQLKMNIYNYKHLSKTHKPLIELFVKTFNKIKNMNKEITKRMSISLEKNTSINSYLISNLNSHEVDEFKIDLTPITSSSDKDPKKSIFSKP